jgi:5-methylcytosine-specific restriction enzyme B
VSKSVRRKETGTRRERPTVTSNGPHLNPLGASLARRAAGESPPAEGAPDSAKVRRQVVVPLPFESRQRTWSASSDLYSYITERGFFFPREVVSRYLLALKTKPFVMFSGIPGTGKTKLALLTAEYFAHTEGTKAFRMERPQDTENAFYLKLDAVTLRSGTLAPHRDQFDYFNLEAGSSGTITCNITNLLGASGDMTFRISNLVYGGSKHLNLNVPISVRRAFEDTGVQEGDYLKFEIAEEFKRFNVSLFRPERQQVEELPENRYTFVSVRPSWDDHTALLGEYDERLERYLRTPVLELLLRAKREEDEAKAQNRQPAPYFIVLDEMNIAQIEHYFSDFLSALESRRYDADGTIRQEPLNLHSADAEKLLWIDEQGVEYEVPTRLEIPTNVLFTGTVNEDDSTFSLSPKVLDRASTMVFSNVDFDAFLGLSDEGAAAKSPFELPPAKTQTFRLGSLELSGQGEAQQMRDRLQPLLTLNELLAPLDLHFGYRILNDIALYLRLATEEIGSDEAVMDAAIDIQILEKVLPKVMSSAMQTGIMETLLHYCTYGDIPDDVPNASALLGAIGLDGDDRAMLADGSYALFPRSAGRLHRVLSARSLRELGSGGGQAAA